MTFGANHPAKGWLMGEKHDGIRQMFKIIEFARMMVGTKAIATLSTGYLNALEYAKERVQGADLAQFTDKTAPRVTITHHPDVRRSLMTQKAYAEGMRSLVLYTAAVQDEVLAKEAAGEDASAAKRLNDLLLPIVKGYGSEKSYEQLAQSLQTLGGSGYLQEYPIEQYIRDSKIDTLYEGTTAIQAQDFFFRKIARDRGVALAHVAGEIKKFVERDDADQRLKKERTLLATALGETQTMVATLTQYLMGAQEQPTELYKVGLGSVRFLEAFGDLMIGWLLLEHAEIALSALDAGVDASDKAFYEGKVAAASFFAKNVLPELSVARQIITDVDLDIMELDEAAF